MNMTDNTVTRADRVAHFADLFIDKFAVRPYPVAQFCSALFGDNPEHQPVGDERVAILEAAVQAAGEIWTARRADSYRLANDVIGRALLALNGEQDVDRIAYRNLIEKAAWCLS